MRTSTWLRIAAVVTLLLAIGHTLGHPWTPMKTLPAEGVVAAMQAVHFTVEGASRSYFDFYQGFGWAIGALVLTLAIVLWRLGDAAARGERSDPVLLAALFVGFVLNGLAAALFIALLPAAFSVIAAIALAGAFLAARRRAR